MQDREFVDSFKDMPPHCGFRQLMILVGVVVAGCFALSNLTATELPFSRPSPSDTLPSGDPHVPIRKNLKAAPAEPDADIHKDTEAAPAEPHIDSETDTEAAPAEPHVDRRKERMKREVIEAYPESLVPTEQIPGHHTLRVWLENHHQGDVPMLSPDRSPYSDTWENSMSICACMLQENTTDVREWLLYHRYGPYTAHDMFIGVNPGTLCEFPAH